MGQPFRRPDASADMHIRVSAWAADMVATTVAQRALAGMYVNKSDVVEEAIRFWAGNRISDVAYGAVNREQARRLLETGREVSRVQLIEEAIMRAYDGGGAQQGIIEMEQRDQLP